VPHKTATRRLAEQLLGGEDALEEFIKSRRAEGRAWRLIERDLYETIDLDITYETLRVWFPDAASDHTGVAS
jgi:hypothetical protein